MRTLSRLVGVSAAVGLGLVAVGLDATTARAATPAHVSILHAVPGATVDVYVNGERLLQNFEPGTLTDPQSLPAGTYDLKVVQAGDGASGAAVAEAENTKVPAGANITVVAHLDADGDPTLTPYVNDVAKIAAGQARITARHTAAAPEVDVRADGEVVFGGLTNPDEESAEVAAGTIEADVVLAGTSDVAIGPASLNLAEGTSTIVYAWGSAEDDNLELAVQTIKGLHSNPRGVPGGTGGQAAQLGAGPVPIGLAGVALLGVALSARQLNRRRVVVGG